MMGPAPSRPQPQSSPPRRSKTKTRSKSQSRSSSGNGGVQKLKKLRIREIKGNLFNAPDGAVLLHGCNCQGIWGGGIAAQFAKSYPTADLLHKNYCASFKNRVDLAGSGILLDPIDEGSPRHYVGCLFTSVNVGRRKDLPDVITNQTVPAMRHMLAQIAQVQQRKKLGQIRMNRINSGLFAVPWPLTKLVLEGIDLKEGWPEEIVVCVQ